MHPLTRHQFSGKTGKTGLGPRIFPVSLCAILMVLTGMLATMGTASAQTMETNTNTSGGWGTNNSSSNFWNGTSFNDTNWSTATTGALYGAVFTNTSGSIAVNAPIFLNALSYTATTGSFQIGVNSGSSGFTYTNAANTNVIWLTGGATSSLAIGQYVNGVNIDAAQTITNIVGNAVYLSANPKAANPSSVTGVSVVGTNVTGNFSFTGSNSYFNLASGSGTLNFNSIITATTNMSITNNANLVFGYGATVMNVNSNVTLTLTGTGTTVVQSLASPALSTSRQGAA